MVILLETERKLHQRITYSVQPRATESYTNNVIARLSDDVTDIATIIEVSDTSSIAVGGVLVIDDENFRIASRSGSKVTVEKDMTLQLLLIT